VPGRGGVGQDGEGDHRISKAIDEPVVITKEAGGQVRVALGLEFDVDQEGLIGAVSALDPGKFINVPGTRVGIWNQGLEFLIEELRSVGTFDGLGDRGKTEVEELNEVGFEGFLPGTVEVDGFDGFCGHPQGPPIGITLGGAEILQET
jgi:hypothetical protein